MGNTRADVNEFIAKFGRKIGKRPQRKKFFWGLF